jgi:hypothetical protein
VLAVLRVSRIVYLEGKVGVVCAEGEQGSIPGKGRWVLAVLRVSRVSRVVYLEGKGGVGCAEGEQGSIPGREGGCWLC